VERLLPAVPTGLVEAPSPADGRIRFAHALVRDAVYATLPPTRRSALHRRAAELLEPFAVARDDRAGAIARHWYRAGAPDRALTWAIRAADAARAAGAYDESARYLRLALDTLDRGPSIDADRAELLLDLARAEYHAGHLPESLATAERAAVEGTHDKRWDVAARAAIVVQGIGHLAANRRVERLCRQALAMPAGDTAPGLRSRVEAQLSCVLLELDEVDEAIDWSTRALVDATAGGDPDAELDAVRARATVTWDPGLHDELTELGRRAIELAGPTGRPLAELWGRIWRSDTAVQRVDMPAVHREVAALAALADRSGLPLVRWHLLRRQASLAALAGRFDSYRALAAEAAALAADWDDDSIRGTHFGQAVCVGLLRGDRGELPPGWRGMLAGLGALPLIAHAVVVAALLLDGDLDQAEAIYRPLVAGVAGMTRGLGRPVIAYLCDLAPAFGDEAGCRAVREVLTTAYGTSPAVGAGTVFYHGATARMLARLDLGAGEPETAVKRFEAGLRIDERLGALPFLAQGRLGLARALAATGDTTSAIPYARSAAAEARRLDMPGLLRDADAFLAAQTARAHTDQPLTAREREIVELVAQALSNRQVAARLVLSERTVESHVRRILAKLDLTSRTDLTRWYLQGPARR
jgi:DNA-binding CsgD family transcriptional regulator